MPQPCLQLVQRYAVGHHVLGGTVAQRVVTDSFTWGFGTGLLCRGPATGSSGGGEPAKLIDAKPANMVDAGQGELIRPTRHRSNRWGNVFCSFSQRNHHPILTPRTASVRLGHCHTPS